MDIKIDNVFCGRRFVNQRFWRNPEISWVEDNASSWTPTMLVNDVARGDGSPAEGDVYDNGPDRG